MGQIRTIALKKPKRLHFQYIHSQIEYYSISIHQNIIILNIHKLQNAKDDFFLHLLEKNCDFFIINQISS